MSWSPSEVLLVKREGSHCMSCSEEKPRMAQLVRIPTNTMPRITSNQTPMSRALQGKGEDNQLFMNGIYDQGYIHTCIYSKTARIFHSIRLCYSMIKLVSKWIRREGEIPFLNKHLCCMYPHWLYLRGEVHPHDCYGVCAARLCSSISKCQPNLLSSSAFGLINYQFWFSLTSLGVVFYKQLVVWINQSEPRCRERGM